MKKQAPKWTQEIFWYSVPTITFFITFALIEEISKLNMIILLAEFIILLALAGKYLADYFTKDID